MRKAFKFITGSEVETPVIDSVSATIPDQTLSLRELLMKFSYIGTEKLEEIVNRGFDGDEDDDLLGVDVGSLDLAEVHDRILYLQAEQNNVRSVHVEPVEDDISVTPMDSVEDAAK